MVFDEIPVQNDAIDGNVTYNEGIHDGIDSAVSLDELSNVSAGSNVQTQGVASQLKPFKWCLMKFLFKMIQLLEMVKPSSVTPLKSKGVRVLPKVFHLYVTTIEKVQPKETKQWNDSKTTKTLFQKFDSLTQELP
ncbi:hypothetical protein V6N12_030462 [Hibiscus sabdariffa]|uniref:Uncharacterized protein n=1 Tax=Hibiscus sabdariffa TaxID=183260 RepID=A0ABR2C156_9ROSI